jgi:hypothetical protein
MTRWFGRHHQSSKKISQLLGTTCVQCVDWDALTGVMYPPHGQPNQSVVSAKLKDASLIQIVISRGANSGNLRGAFS